METGLGKFRALLPREPLIELLFELMEVAYVARCIFALRLAKLVAAPIARLLLFRQVDVEQFLDKVLEAVAIGVGPDQARRGAGAVDRRSHDAEVKVHDSKVEAGKMVKFKTAGIDQQRLEIWGRIIAIFAEADEMLFALPVGQLHDA